MQWPHVETTLVNLAQGTVEFAFNWLLQSTLLISTGLVVGKLLSTQGSALQSFVYRMTLAAAVLCPLLTLALSVAGVSGWSPGIPQAWVSSRGGIRANGPGVDESKNSAGDLAFSRSSDGDAKTAPKSSIGPVT